MTDRLFLAVLWILGRMLAVEERLLDHRRESSVGVGEASRHAPVG